MATSELIFRIKADSADFKSTMAQVRAELAQTQRAQATAAKGELSLKQQLSAAASLDKQRMAAALVEFKKHERQMEANARAAARLAAGVKPVGQNLQQITDIMQALGSSSAALQGPMGGVASRLHSLGSIATEAGGGLGVAGAATAALVVAAAAATVAVAKLNQQAFEAAQTWSRYGEEIFKAKLITGQSAEQLSVLKIIASETDTSFESLTRTAAKLQVSISKGITEPSSEAGRALKFLQLNTEEFKKSTPDQQLQLTAKALNAVTNQADKNRASTALLSRGYTESAAALHDIAERYDETRERAKALGLVMSDEAVEAAHKFDDAMDAVKTGLIAFTVQVGQRTAPAILAALDDVARSLGLNQNSWREWGRVTGEILAAVVTGTVRAARDISTAIRNLPLAMLGGPLGTVEWARQIALTDAKEYEKQVAILRQAYSEADRVGRGGLPTGGEMRLGAGILRSSGPSFPGSDKRGARGGSAERISAGQRLLNQLKEEHNRLLDKSNELTKLQIVLLDERFKKATPAERQLIEAEARGIETVEKKIDLDKKKAEATEKIRALLNSQTEAIHKARMGEEEWNAEIVQLEAELKKLGLTMDKDTKSMLEQNAQIQRNIKLTRERIALEQTRIDRQTRERIATPERKQEQLEIEQQGPLGDIAAQAAGGSTAGLEAMSAWQQALANIVPLMENFNHAATNYVVAGFHGMASAAQEAIQGWLLYGGSLAKALKMAVASELASIAARATVQAAMHAAYSIGALAMGNFGAAATHALAAAKFLAVAGLTGIGARALAGSASAAAHSGSLTARSAFESATRVGSGSTAQTTLDVNRRANAQPTNTQPTGTLTINLGLKDGIVAEQFRRDYMLNGPTRLIIKTDGQG